MYFQIENTPEHIRRARRAEKLPKETPKEECPRLILAPFSRPPQVVFDNVLVGTTCERSLEVFNPSKQSQQITLGKALPPGLVIHLPGEWLDVEPETCYCLTMVWSPMQPTAIRETLRFTNENRGRYDVVVVLKSVMNVKGKGNQNKGYKISPGKIKKKVVSKKSPVAIYKKKAEIIYNTTTKLKKTVNVYETEQYIQRRSYSSNKENIMAQYDNYPRDTFPNKCPFDSPSSIDVDFNTSEIFSNVRKTNILQDTYDKSYTINNGTLDIPNNILKPSNKQFHDTTATDIFDNLTFTPLKAVPNKAEKLNKGPKIILSVNSESDFDDSLDMKDKENQTHSIISITSSQPPNKWLTVNHHTNIDNQLNETPLTQSKKHPNTSSPKEVNSPNFSINTDFSRISDLSFFPQRFSTERKCFPKVNETHEILDDHLKVSSDTYTKDSPNTPMDNAYHMHAERVQQCFNREPRMCRQSLFREYQLQKEACERNMAHQYEHNPWHSELRAERSPPRSITPPLQSIPEESTQLSETQTFDRTDKQTTFTVNRTFDKISEKSLSTTTLQTWSKKAVRAEPELWKIPVTQPKKSLKPKPKPKASISGKISNVTFESNKSINQNITVNQIGNVYSQSSTVDPFLSSTYFYDEEAVDKFEVEFKRWLNCILTPPADLESNIEQKIDVGKAWIENRNKEVPLAPTKEQVSSVYHNSHRLESLRRQARTLLMTSDIAQVFQKLNAQIEKKLIVIRTDRNLHLDVGLQKIIMEMLLSYNPLWLRIGLEAIYDVVLPLKSNSDIEGLTTFIIQRMFKNPHLKNKHSKSNAPNMLLPAYMEAIKKFTLKKFFMLVFFLDQAKQKKLISHDPCLFCRNALCKESREIIIRFTRELIAGIGDITKHLRPLGYVVSHKQSYLDEYKYAVHNLALDIRDGVRLTKVMEIILMKNGLLIQLRTPPISRLQKIHNVQVALNSLKEANFVIVGDITPTDIADGHREKTLSLLWQLIHVFRAPLFEKAANVIQIWWRKKYEVIVEKRREEERIQRRINNAASIIQYWWRKIQYNRQVEWQMQQITTATIVVQKYCRMWLCRTRLRRYKTSVLKIEEWYQSIKMMKEAKVTLKNLKIEREELRRRSAITIQSYIRRWICSKQYRETIQKIVKVQSFIRTFILRKRYLTIMKTTTYIQNKYRGKLLMRTEMLRFAQQKRSAIIIQSYYRMVKQRRNYLELKKCIAIFEDRYIALVKMREARKEFLKLKTNAIKIQALFRRKKCRNNYIRQRNAIVLLQQKIKAHQLMKEQKAKYLQIKKSTQVIQMYTKSLLEMRKVRSHFLTQKKSAILIQQYFRAYLIAKSQRESYIKIRNASITLQKHYRNLTLMRKERSTFVNLKTATIKIQRCYRAQIEMRKCKENYSKLRMATLSVQRKYRALLLMREQRQQYLKMRRSCINIQNAFKAFILKKKERNNFLKLKEATIKIQRWFRNCRKGIAVKQEYQEIQKACVTIQAYYKAYIIGTKQKQEFIRIKTATVCIQKFYRSYIEMKTVRRQYIQLKTSTVKIQTYYRSYLETKKQRSTYLQMKSAVSAIECCYRRCKEYQNTRQNYLRLRQAAINVQRRYRAKVLMNLENKEYKRLKHATVILQQRYRAVIAMRKEKQYYMTIYKAILTIQIRYRALCLMRQIRKEYLRKITACTTIQSFFRAYSLGCKQRQQYLELKKSAVVLQTRYKALLAMRKERTSYLAKRNAAICIQNRFRAHQLMLNERQKYIGVVTACKVIQAAYRAHLVGKKQREYTRLRTAVILIQHRYRLMVTTKMVRKQYISLRNTAVFVQRRFRENKLSRALKRNTAATKIQIWYRSVRQRDICRQEYLQIRNKIIIAQSVIRMHILRKRFNTLKSSAITMQRYYRSYKLATKERLHYLNVKRQVIKLQSYVRSCIERKRYIKLRSSVLMIQAVYRLHRLKTLERSRRESAAICLQKNVRRYLIEKWYKTYREKVMYIQEIWRGKLFTRLLRCEFLQKRRLLIKIQAVARGYLVRKQVEYQKQHILKVREEKRQNWAASKIQALFRGHRARVLVAHDKRVAELRRRWREGALQSTQESLKQRNEEAMEVLRNMYDIETVIRAFRSLELLTEVFPMMYNDNASSIVRRVHVYMSVTNRSISSIEVLKSAAAVLVNLTRYRVTGPKIYARDRIPPILKFMWRFSNSEKQLFCILCTYLWLFSKYEEVRKDLKEFLHIPENHKMIITIKGNVDRMKRMANNSRSRFSTPQAPKYISHTNNSMNMSVCSNSSTSILLPALEPDYGIVRIDKPRYFEDAQQAINCLFSIYDL